MAHTIRVAALQKRMGGVIPTAEFESLRQKGVDLVCLPEYYFVPSKVRSQIETAALKKAILQRIQLYSNQLVGVVVGGTLIEEEYGRYYNTCPVFDCGKFVGSYRKMFPTPREREKGISSGTSHTVVEVRGIRLGLLICADVLYSASFNKIRELQ
ncbi:carbon-nitrogen hydrolase family protein, partial [bacterium]|nr:carbon-nitrogen hydrolase family protein [bacterium]